MRLLLSFCAYAADSLSPVSPPIQSSSFFGVLRWDHGNRAGLEGGVLGTHPALLLGSVVD